MPADTRARAVGVLSTYEPTAWRQVDGCQLSLDAGPVAAGAAEGHEIRAGKFGPAELAPSGQRMAAVADQHERISHQPILDEIDIGLLLNVDPKSASPLRTASVTSAPERSRICTRSAVIAGIGLQTAGIWRKAIDWTVATVTSPMPSREVVRRRSIPWVKSAISRVAKGRNSRPTR